MKLDIKSEKIQSSSLSAKEYVFVRVATVGPKQKKMLMNDLKTQLNELAAKSELYGEILISGDPIEFEE